jgi:hypothetical protein
VVPPIKVLKPGPLKLPSTFCAPCAIITAAKSQPNRDRKPRCRGRNQSSKHLCRVLKLFQ